MLLVSSICPKKTGWLEETSKSGKKIVVKEKKI